MPALDPDEKTLTVLTGLRDAGFDDILLIDDGSADGEEGRPDVRSIFERAEALGCEVLHHGKCAGRGAALRTGFRYFLNTRKDRAGVVTVDSDGQHRPEDAVCVASLMLERGDAIVIGRRDLSDKTLPQHTRTSGRVTSLMVRLFCGLKLRDPQSGLRAIPTRHLEELCRVKGDRYEYEINILLESKTRSIPVIECDIDADYSAADRTTHYRSVRDSVRINSMFLKFAMSSLSSCLIDILCFWFFAHLLNSSGGRLETFAVPIASVAARVISTFFGYIINRHGVFGTKGSSRKTVTRYVISEVAIMLASALCTWLLTTLLGANVAWVQTLLKCVVDTALFFVNFRLQHEWVFTDQ